MPKQLFSTLSLIMLIFAGVWWYSGFISADADKEIEHIKIKVAWWGEQPRHNYTLEVIELFEKKYPHISIEPEYSNWDDYWKKLAPKAAANQLPDVIQMDLLYLKPYSEMLENLTPFINNEIIKTDHISPSILLGGNIGQNSYGFPLGLNAPAVIVDQDLLSSAGINLPDETWTWADFEEVAKMVHNNLRIYGTTGMKPPDVFFSYYLRSHGVNMYNKNGTGLGYEDDQLFIDYFEMQLRLLDHGSFPRPDVTESIKKIGDELLVNHQSSMSWAYSNQYIGFSQAANRTIELIEPPGQGLDKGLSVKPSMLFSIAKSSKHKEAAGQFIDFFINDVEANKLIKGDRGVPVSSKIVEKIEKNLSEEQRKVFEYVNNVNKSAVIVEKADPHGSNEVVRILQDLSNQILFKRITPEEGALQFRKEATKILAKNN